MGAAKNDATGAKDAGARRSALLRIVPCAAAAHEQKTQETDAEQHGYCPEAALQGMKDASSEVHRGRSKPDRRCTGERVDAEECASLIGRRQPRQHRARR